MKELGITKGTYWMGKSNGVVVTDSNTYTGKDTLESVEYYGGYLIAESMTTADAELLIDAGNTAQKCGLLPSELLRQRDELREALTELVHLHGCEQEGIGSGQPTPQQWYNAVELAEAAIKNTEMK